MANNENQNLAVIIVAVISILAIIILAVVSFLT